MDPDYAVLYRDAWLDPVDTETEARTVAADGDGSGNGMAMHRVNDEPFRTIDGNLTVAEQLAIWRDELL